MKAKHSEDGLQSKKGPLKFFRNHKMAAALFKAGDGKPCKSKVTYADEECCTKGGDLNSAKNSMYGQKQRPRYKTKNRAAFVRGQ